LAQPKQSIACRCQSLAGQGKGPGVEGGNRHMKRPVGKAQVG
jgi:hypothetical protein